MRQKDGYSSYDELIQDYLEGQATPTEEKRFRLLLGEETFRRRVAEYACDFGSLYMLARQGMLDESALPLPRRSSHARSRLLAVAGIAASILIAFAILWGATDRDKAEREIARPVEPARQEVPPAGDPDPQPVVATVVGATGKVRLRSGPDAALHYDVQDDMPLRSGGVLETVGEDSFALVRFDDESVVAVGGNTELSCSIVDSQKQLVVRGGDVLARVAPQPEGKAMQIATPTARTEVVGTRLSLFASLVLTRLTVLEGCVRFHRLSDKKAIEVNEGECAVASEDSDLVARPVSPAKKAWDEDFEQGTPPRWRAGLWAHDDLPAGSSGAIQAAPREDKSGPCFISSGNEWMHGLFPVAKDTHLNLTYRLKKPGWFYIMVQTRSEDYTSTYRGSYVFQTPELWEIPPNTWRTISIPLDAFRETQQSRPDSTSRAAPLVGDVVFILNLRTQKQDPGLVVDRIWVTEGPCESAELLKTQ